LVLVFITVVNIENLDLNLLPVLQAVLAEKSATAAAKRLHVTQSAVSNALARLRRALGDPLLVRSARGLSPTPRARALEPELARIMRSLQALVSGDAEFDAATSTREFSVACADYCTTILGPALADRLRVRAPNASLRFVSLEQLVSTDGLATNIDVHLGMPAKVPSGCHSLPLFEDSFVCLLQKRAKPATKRISLAKYLAAQHVRVAVLGSRGDAIDVALAKRKLSRSVALTVSHFSVVPMMVERGGYVATLSRRLAQTQARQFDVAWCETPVSLGKRATRMIWHERTDADPGARFLRQLVKDAVG
jgi:DNA-binding transcriptional LysR family regulator